VEVVGHRQGAQGGALWVLAGRRLGQGQGFRGGLLARSVLGDGEELWGVCAHGGGGRTGGAGEGAGGQGRLADGNGWREHPDLLVGGLLNGALKLSHLIHGHVWVGEKRKMLSTKWSTGEEMVVVDLDIYTASNH